MKRISILVFILLITTAANAQDKNFAYCELVGTQKLLSAKLTVQIDHGQESKLFDFSDSKRIVDPETGKPKDFNSMVDAMNYMGVLGWEFVQAYTITLGQQNVYHWILKKEVSDEDIENAYPETKGFKNKE